MKDTQVMITDPKLRGSLSAADRKDYIAAVQCLSKKPARYNSTIAPGAKTRYDVCIGISYGQVSF